MFMLAIVLVSVFWMTLLPEPPTNFAISLPELVADDTTVPELPECLLELPVSVNFLLVKSQAGFPQFREGVTEFMEINLRFDGTLLSELFDPEESIEGTEVKRAAQILTYPSTTGAQSSSGLC